MEIFCVCVEDCCPLCVSLLVFSLEYLLVEAVSRLSKRRALQYCASYWFCHACA